MNFQDRMEERNTNFVEVRNNWGHLCTVDHTTESGKRCPPLGIVFVAIIPCLVLIVQSGIKLHVDEINLYDSKTIKTKIQFSLEIINVVHRIQTERGTTVLYIGNKGDPDIFTRLTLTYKNTDEAVLQMTQWDSMETPAHFFSKKTFHDRIKNFRHLLDHSNLSVFDVVDFYTKDNDIFLHWIVDTVRHAQKVAFWTNLVTYNMLIISKEQAGVERALGSAFHTQGGLSLQDLLLYKEKVALGKSYLERSKEYSPDVVRILDERFTGTPLEEILTNMRSEILQNTVKPISSNLGEIWFDNMTEFINILKDVEEYFGYNIIQRTDEDIEETQKQVTYSIIILVFVCVLLPTVAFSIHKLTNKIHQFAIALEQKACDLTEERKRTETLLYQMLPSSVAKTMMRNRSVLPEFFESVTVMFSVIVEFTDIAFRSTPMQVVDLLNTMYMTFDDLIHNYDAYKVETIGDAYMIVSGLPTRNENKHVPEIAILSLDLLSATGKIKIPHMPEKSVECRIGIHTGPVVAGVVGTKMPRYCVFGDTVNTASRMESIGEARKIQITHATYTALLNSKIKFTFVRRGFIAVKGKGQMETYWLSGVDKSKSCQ